MRNVRVEPWRPPQPSPPPQPWDVAKTALAAVLVFVLGVVASYPFAASEETAGAVGLSVWVVGAVVIVAGRWRARRRADRVRQSG